MKKFIIILGVFGTSFSAIFARVSTVSSVILVFYRMLFAVLFLCPLIGIFHRGEFKDLHIKDVMLCIVSGIFLGMHFILYFSSLFYTSISSSVVLVDTEIFFVAAGSIIVLGEVVNRYTWISLFITFCGSVVIACGDMGKGNILGDIMAIGGAICSAVYTLIGRKCRKNISTSVYTGIVYFFAAIISLIAAVCMGENVTSCGGVNLLVALGITVFCTLLGHSVYNWGLKYEKASFISAAKLLEPIFASVLGVLFFLEIPSITSCVGGVIIVVGIFRLKDM